VTERYLTSLHEAGHAIVGKAVGHDVYLIHVGREPPYEAYCDGGYMGGDIQSELRRALVTLGGYFAAAMYGQGLGFNVNNWDNAEQDWSKFQRHRGGMTYRHARRKVVAILREQSEALLAMAVRVDAEGDVVLGQHPSEYAIACEAIDAT
jgi:hypothetical protein